jgi:hypothetical protein
MAASALAVLAAAAAAAAEAPLAAAFGLRLLLEGMARAESQYLRPHLAASRMTPGRELGETTYYARACGPGDVSTVSARDLYLNLTDPGAGAGGRGRPTADVSDEAYRTFLRHGAVVFPSVLSRDTAARLRDFIIRKNLAQPPGEMEFLHSPKHRCVAKDEATIRRIPATADPHPHGFLKTSFLS